MRKEAKFHSKIYKATHSTKNSLTKLIYFDIIVTPYHWAKKVINHINDNNNLYTAFLTDSVALYISLAN